MSPPTATWNSTSTTSTSPPRTGPAAADRTARRAADRRPPRRPPAGPAHRARLPDRHDGPARPGVRRRGGPARRGPRAMSHQVRAAEEWPLFDLRAHRLDGTTTRLHISVDLLIADAHSTRVLTGELLALYHDARAELPALGCTFRDYVLAVEALRADRAIARRGATGPTGSPTCRRPGLPLLRRPEELTARSSTACTPNSPRTPGRRCGTGRPRRASPVGGGLRRVLRGPRGVERQPRFTLNVTTFNRLLLHPDVDALVGDFTATTLLAVDGSAEPTFRARAQRLQSQLWRDLDHRTVTGWRCCACCAPRIRAGGTAR
ncbi:hypothetical protein NKH77_07490 [Streptomyces sp. M19]